MYIDIPILAYLPHIISEICSRYDTCINTQTVKTLRTGSLITIFLPLGTKNLFVMTVIRQCLNSY